LSLNFNDNRWRVTNIQNLREWFLWCFLAAFPLFFAVTPSFILSGMKMQNKRTGLRLAFWKKASLGILGGIVGEIIAIAMYHPAESSWCNDMSAQGSYCGGQGPLVLILTVPLGAISEVAFPWFGPGTASVFERIISGLQFLVIVAGIGR
jgi:hypothetical protein